MLGHAPALLGNLQQIPLRTHIAGEIARSRGIKISDINLHVARLFEDEVCLMAKILDKKFRNPDRLAEVVAELALPPVRD